MSLLPSFVMTLWKSIGSLFSRAKATEPAAAALIFYVRCRACGEIIRVRVNPQWDLAPVWDEPPAVHRLDKEVRGIRCQRLMMLHVTFDAQYTLLSQEAEGATLATPDEYRTSQGGS